MVVFGQDANIIRTFQKVEKDTLISVIQGAESPSGGTNIVDALQASKMLFFQPSGGARPDSRKIIVIMIDRKSVNTESQLEKVVDEYERNKVKFVTVVTYLMFLHHCKNHIVDSEIIHHACFNIMSTMQRLNHT